MALLRGRVCAQQCFGMWPADLLCRADLRRVSRVQRVKKQRHAAAHSLARTALPLPHGRDSACLKCSSVMKRDAASRTPMRTACLTVPRRNCTAHATPPERACRITDPPSVARVGERSALGRRACANGEDVRTSACVGHELNWLDHIAMKRGPCSAAARRRTSSATAAASELWRRRRDGEEVNAHEFACASMACAMRSAATP